MGSITSFAYMCLNMLSMMLSFYFYIIVISHGRHGTSGTKWDQKDIVRYFEFPAYCITVVISLGISIAAIINDNYNYFNLAHTCTIIKQPCINDEHHGGYFHNWMNSDGSGNNQQDDEDEHQTSAKKN